MKTQNFRIIIILVIVLFSISRASGYTLNPDTIHLNPGIPATVDLLANDVFSPQDSVNILQFRLPGMIIIKQSFGVYEVTAPGWGTLYPEGYYIVRVNDTVIQVPVVPVVRDNSFARLDTNDVSALFCSNGLHFFRENAEYFVPKWTSKTSIFSNSLWIGGKDNQGDLHLAAQRYGQGIQSGNPHTKFDFYSGPVMDANKYSIYTDTVWNYVWKINKDELEYHIAHWWEPGYVIPHDILTWPGNGDTTLGQAWQLAPFYDMNNDGVYDPARGDCPEIRGDQALFFIFNDDRGDHLETNGEKMRVEIHGMAYAFDIPTDSAMKTTTFLNYQIFNRSQNTYDSTYIGMFTDIDLGFAEDDFVACDVERNMFIGYNGKPADGSGQENAYGENPPVQGVMLLSGPLMDPDGEDNPQYGTFGEQLCNYSVNGSNFGDEVIDNERYGLTGFFYFNNTLTGVPYYMTDPDSASQYYLYLQNKFKDGTTLRYGGNGHPQSGGTGPVTRYMYPGLSDTINWGTGCIDVEPKNWTEFTAANNPSDRRGLCNTGPFTFHPGDMQEIDIAFIWARSYSKVEPADLIGQYADQIVNSYRTNQLSNGGQFIGVNELKKSILWKVYPNPADDFVAASFENTVHGSSIELVNTSGVSIRYWKVTTDKVSLDISGISPGLYLLKANTDKGVAIEKVLIK